MVDNGQQAQQQQASVLVHSQKLERLHVGLTVDTDTLQ